MQAFLQIHFGVTTARYLFVDSADWEAAWDSYAAPNYIRQERINMLCATPDWWADLARDWMVVGWYVHDILQNKFDDETIHSLSEHGALLLLGAPM